MPEQRRNAKPNWSSAGASAMPKAKGSRRRAIPRSVPRARATPGPVTSRGPRAAGGRETSRRARLRQEAVPAVTARGGLPADQGEPEGLRPLVHVGHLELTRSPLLQLGQQRQWVVVGDQQD